MVTLFLMFRARFAYLSVLIVSTKSRSHGDTQAIMIVREFPPRESCKSRVNFESRYGIWSAFLDRSPRAEITFPRASSPQLMEIPSLALSPTAPVRLRRSDPARSTKWNLADRFSNSGSLRSYMKSSVLKSPLRESAHYYKHASCLLFKKKCLPRCMVGWAVAEKYEAWIQHEIYLSCHSYWLKQLSEWEHHRGGKP